MIFFKNKFWMVLLFVTAFFAGSAPNARAATTVSENIVTDTTWTAAGSPYIISKAIVLDAGATLTIGPGVTVQPAFGLTTNRTIEPLVLNQNTHLVISGTEAAPVVIKDFSIREAAATITASYASFYGITGGGGNPYSTVDLDHVVLGAFSFSRSNITIRNSTITGRLDTKITGYAGSLGTLTMENTSVTSMYPDGVGLEFSAFTVALTNVTIHDVPIGLYLYRDGDVTANNLYIYGSSIAGIKSDTTDTFDHNILDMYGSEIAGNAVGLMLANKPTLDVRTNSIHDNGIGATYTSSLMAVLKNNWWGSASGPYNATSNPSGTGNSVNQYITYSPWLVNKPFTAKYIPSEHLPPAPDPDDPVSSGSTTGGGSGSSTTGSGTGATTTGTTGTGMGAADGSSTSGSGGTGTNEGDTSSGSTTDTGITGGTGTGTGGTTGGDSGSGSGTGTEETSPQSGQTDQDQNQLPANAGGAVSDDTSESQNTTASARVPVLIVPGVLGTEMRTASEKLWLDILRNVSDQGDEFMDPLQFDANLQPVDQGVSLDGVLKGKLNAFGTTFFDYSQALISQFNDIGYQEGTDLFLFPYDWRYGVDKKITDALRQKIEAIRSQTGSDKVDIIAHSTGGLLVKEYAIEHPADHHIRKAVFVGVPNTGAPKAIKTLLQGDNFSVPMLSDSEMKKLARNMPVVYDLAPSPQYYLDSGSFFQIVHQSFPGIATKEDLNFDQSEDRLRTQYDLNAAAFSGAISLHSASFDSFDLRSVGIDIYSIIGAQTGTLGKIAEIQAKTLGGISTSYAAPYEVSGDGTVPLSSSESLPVDLSHKYYALKADHAQMLSQKGIRELIVNILSGSSLVVDPAAVTQDRSKTVLGGHLLSIFSPLSIDVTDALGNHAGLAADGVSIENTIPGADYEILGEHKFVYLPDDEGQTYSIRVIGTGTGDVTVTDALVENGQTATVQVFSGISSTPHLEGSIILGDTAMIAFDTNGDGVPDQTISPSETLTDTDAYYPDFREAQAEPDAAEQEAPGSAVTVQQNETQQAHSFTGGGTALVQETVPGPQATVEVLAQAMTLENTPSTQHESLTESQEKMPSADEELNAENTSDISHSLAASVIGSGLLYKNLLAFAAIALGIFLFVRMVNKDDTK